MSGYLHPFRVRDAHNKPTDRFEPGTDFNIIWRRYNFDRRLRTLLIDAIERLEVAVRSRLVYHFVHSTNSAGIQIGPFGHLDPLNLLGFKTRPFLKKLTRNLKRLLKFKGFELSEHDAWLAKLQNERQRATDTFVKHFSQTYGDCHDYLPLWMACELMTCETALQFAHGLDPSIVKKAAADFGFPDQQLLSWTKAIFTLRNACAHHARVWNRVIGVKPSVPGKNKNPQWHLAPGFAPDRVGLMLTVCQFWLGKISVTSHWKQRLFALFDEFPEIPLADMGLPQNWRSHPLWR
ncbi:hypothetical protein AW736_02690 [Termitidicoccus mucosus]|uniref:DNA-binding protein n=1 Tax=Termitidicoccus mucosus TaxID=1184151 RepID=A0A178INV8_9BACT|nr:hypothetical protein AW736_02690 [Opitutaceae bacterium TSB47]